MMMVNDDSRIINKLEASLTDDARVIIYNRHIFIVQATGLQSLTNAFQTFNNQNIWRRGAAAFNQIIFVKNMLALN